MKIEFSSLPLDIQARLIRARVDELCRNDTQLYEMIEDWTHNIEGITGRRSHMIPTTRILHMKD